MIPPETHFRKLILVCTNEREGGEICCAMRGSADIHKKLKAAVKERAADIRVSKTGCLDNCATGVSVVIMPDDIWLGDVKETDIPEIIELIFK